MTWHFLNIKVKLITALASIDLNVFNRHMD